MDRAILQKLISENATARKFNLGEIVFRERDPPDIGLCLVLTGSIRVTMEHEGKQLFLGTIGTGEFFGETALVLQRKRTATATAAEPGTSVMFLNRQRVIEEAHRNFAFLNTLLQEAVRRMEHMLQVLMRQPVTLAFTVDDSLHPVMAENRRHLARIPGLLNHTRNMFVSPNKPIFTQGQRNDGIMYLVTGGTVALERERPGEEPSLLYNVASWDFFGYSRTGMSPTRFFTAVARGEPAQVIAIDEDLLGRVFRLDMDIAYGLFRSVLVKIVILNDTLHAAAIPVMGSAAAERSEREIRSAFAEPGTAEGEA
jgi:CRP-like cAMP-binding protein